MCIKAQLSASTKNKTSLFTAFCAKKAKAVQKVLFIYCANRPVIQRTKYLSKTHLKSPMLKKGKNWDLNSTKVDYCTAMVQKLASSQTKRQAKSGLGFTKHSKACHRPITKFFPRLV